MRDRKPAGAVPARSGGRIRSACLGALVVVATVVAYLPALKGRFIWNDSDYVTAPRLRSLGGLGRIWFKLGATEQYYPLLHSAFWVENRLWGESAPAYHLLNILLHATAACLLALVLRRLLDHGVGAGRAARGGPMAVGPAPRRYPGAEWLAAALFALHPVHVPSVAWISEQKNTLSQVLYLAAFLTYLGFDETRRPRRYFSALALFCLAMLSKTSTVTLPAALLVVFWWERGRLGWRSDVLPLLPWLALGAGAGIFSSWIERHRIGPEGIGAEGPAFHLSTAGHVLLAGRAIWFYLGSLAWPFHLNFIYRRWKIDGAVWWQWLFPAGVVAVVILLWALRRRTRTPLAVLLLFAGTLFPVLGFVNLYGSLYSRVWDHWQYLADLAPLAYAGVALAGAGTWAGPRFRRAGPALGVALCVLFGVMTWRRCGDFRDNETLYRTTLARNPDCWLAHNNLGLLLENKPGGLPAALKQYEAAVRLAPDVATLRDNLGNALAGTGRLARAVREYEIALRLKPDFVLAHNNLGNTFARMGGARLPEAVAQYEQALRLNPAMPEVHNNLGAALLLLGRTREAITHFEDAVRLDPNLAQAHVNLGVALERVGRAAEAEAQFEQAERLGARLPGRP